MVRNIVFDFGAVLVDWNPRRLYEPYFNDSHLTDYFLQTVCPFEWNTSADGGRPLSEVTQERVLLYPEWEKEIRMYFGQWIKMMGDQIPGMENLLRELRSYGYPLYGLSNWSAETFPLVRDRYPVFSLLDGYVISGQEHCVKPEEKIYRILLERYSLKAAESVFIDDRAENVEAARKLGMEGIVFESEPKLREQLSELLGCSLTVAEEPA